MASQPTSADLLALAFSGQENFVPATEERRPSTFLSLAPTTSSSYPSTPLVKSHSPQSPLNDPTAAAAPNAAALDSELLKTRRSSSLSSNGTQKRRFLKLGPVHFGEGDGDWSEEVVE